MKAFFDGTDLRRQAREWEYLRERHGMSWSAKAVAFHIDDEWQVWWRDLTRELWVYKSSAGVVQIPMSMV